MVAATAPEPEFWLLLEQPATPMTHAADRPIAQTVEIMRDAFIKPFLKRMKPLDRRVPRSNRMPRAYFPTRRNSPFFQHNMPMQDSQELGFPTAFGVLPHKKRRPGGRLLEFKLILSRFAGVQSNHDRIRSRCGNGFCAISCSPSCARWCSGCACAGGWTRE